MGKALQTPDWEIDPPEDRTGQLSIRRCEAVKTFHGMTCRIFEIARILGLCGLSGLGLFSPPKNQKG